MEILNTSIFYQESNNVYLFYFHATFKGELGKYNVGILPYTLNVNGCNYKEIKRIANK